VNVNCSACYNARTVCCISHYIIYVYRRLDTETRTGIVAPGADEYNMILQVYSDYIIIFSRDFHSTGTPERVFCEVKTVTEWKSSDQE